jgi:hypothetical protein
VISVTKSGLSFPRAIAVALDVFIRIVHCFIGEIVDLIEQLKLIALLHILAL